MARKISVQTEYIINAAFELAREEGFEGVTARRLANYLGCSTQPIFRVYRTMEELYEDVYKLIIQDFADYYTKYEKTEQLAFVNLGLAYISYAGMQPHFFRILFLQQKRCGKSLYELLNGSDGNLIREINRAAADGATDPSALFMKMWIFIHGAACMVITKDYDLDEAQTRELLRDSYQSFLKRG